MRNGDYGYIFTSSDGTSWDNRTSASGKTEELNEVIYENSTFVAFGNNGTIRTSSDGTTWDNRTSGTSNDLLGGTYGNSTFVTVGGNSVGGDGTILTSSDATTWTSRTSGTSEGFRRVFYKE